MTRIGVPDYSERAFREGIANALIHRDYTRLGTTYVQWREDRIEISSPGGFPLGVRLDNLLVTEPRPSQPAARRCIQTRWHRRAHRTWHRHHFL